MLFELHQIQRQQSLIQSIQESRKNTYDVVVNSYSKRDKSQKSLKQNFENILKQSALLLHILREIQQNVKHKNLLPALFDGKMLNKLLYSGTNLPDWFQHVFQKQYEKQKNNLQALSLKIYKLHGLSEKNAQLVKDHWNLQILLKRYQSLNQKQLESVDIIQEVEQFKKLCENCKQIFKNFLDMMTKKVLQFLQNTVQSTINYSNLLKKSKSLDNCYNNQGSRNIIAAKAYIPVIKKGDLIQRKNLNQRSTANFKNADNANNLKEYDYCFNNLNQTVEKGRKLSTVQSLKMRQKANNQYFYRKAKQNDSSNENSLTKQITRYKSYQQLKCKNNSHNSRNSHNYYLRAAQQSKNSSIDSARGSYRKQKERNNYYSPVKFSDYGSHEIQDKKMNIYSGRQDFPGKQKAVKQMKINQKNQSKDYKGSNSGSRDCYHHCPHHDKYLNNHCSKHCEKHCSHQKVLSSIPGINLTQMNNQFYNRNKMRNDNSKEKDYANHTSRQKISPQLQSARSLGSFGSLGQLQQRKSYNNLNKVSSRANPYEKNQNNIHKDIRNRSNQRSQNMLKHNIYKENQANTSRYQDRRVDRVKNDKRYNLTDQQQGNVIQNRNYLFNSHQKHQFNPCSLTSRTSRSPLKQNVSSTQNTYRFKDVSPNLIVTKQRIVSPSRNCLNQSYFRNDSYFRNQNQFIKSPKKQPLLRVSQYYY